MSETDTNYTKRDLSISMEKANWVSLLVVSPLLILFGALYFGIWGVEKTITEFDILLDKPATLFPAILSFIGLFGLGVVVHELIHGISWILASRKPWRSIHFGFQVSTLTPYAHCREPMFIGAYRFGILMPGIITGIVPTLIGLFIGNVWVAFMGGFFILAAGGDLLIFLILRNVGRSSLVEDHPVRAGCYVLDPKPETSSTIT